MVVSSVMVESLSSPRAARPQANLTPQQRKTRVNAHVRSGDARDGDRYRLEAAHVIPRIVEIEILFRNTDRTLPGLLQANELGGVE